MSQHFAKFHSPAGRSKQAKAGIAGAPRRDMRGCGTGIWGQTGVGSGFGPLGTLSGDVGGGVAGDPLEGQLRESEAQNLRAVPGDHDVARLRIAMDHAVGMRGRQCNLLLPVALRYPANLRRAKR